ncbi:ABC transporter substrate-binding protein [Companilactobacillus crustorum]|uniref:Family 1 extracellular solute-binding protein n=3 Tax=Companilactobacillus TaxID=2767879 RepID=A0A837RLS6_9LACO|nr:ABC transporter substrate-binding protein [Companilactobacillus crustorum]KRK44497.1 family 1 extracellular solute-binding protein [Companilactobacillus crustorum JCM 15951]KRO21852.1 family 1 extracellular solute-binding protein [Companilactobacillus crustorum]GEO76027.1 ABC transporter substrate-binding protein [Companilactobacillus crustorum]HCD08513.1 ABC transporter substrate-binding protein [Lactobacillus sp.]
MSKYKKIILPVVILLGVIFAALFSRAVSAQSTTKDNRIPIVFWHEMGGPSEQALEKVVDGFNKSQTKYRVIPKYQGTYDEAIQKILQTHNTSTSSAVFQAFDISTAQMLHSGYTTPVQNFIDEDNYDVSKISSVARAFYANKGKQQAMPFNTSQPVLYYNASLLKKYNITPPPVSPSYSDITRVAKELYEKSGHKTKGMTIQVYGWFLEQALANANAQLANQNDGHTGNPTKVKINNPDTVEFLNWIKENIKSGDFIDYGSGASAGANQTAGFLSDKVGIFIQSSASIGQLTQNNKNELGITYFPHPDSKKANGVAIGGAALWISNDKPKDVQRGAFEFIKYTLKPEVQAQWQKSTGYLALNKDSQKTSILKELYAKNPEAKVPGQQLATAKPNYSNSGILMEGMQLTRQLEEVAMETVYNGGDINQALNTADKNINDNLTQLNKANGYK